MFGTGVPITDPAHPTYMLWPTGVNKFGVVSALEDANPGGAEQITPVLWSYTGSPDNPHISVITAQPPSNVSLSPQDFTSRMISAGITDAGYMYGFGDLSVNDPNAGGGSIGSAWAIRWSENGAGTGIGFRGVTATSSNDTIAGIAAQDTGGKDSQNHEVYTCGTFVDGGGAGASQIVPTYHNSNLCTGLDSEGIASSYRFDGWDATTPTDSIAFIPTGRSG